MEGFSIRLMATGPIFLYVDDVDIAAERLPSYWSKNYMRSIAIPKAELERLLTSRARVVSEVSTKSITVCVYEMNSLPE